MKLNLFRISRPNEMNVEYERKDASFSPKVVFSSEILLLNDKLNGANEGNMRNSLERILRTIVANLREDLNHLKFVFREMI